MANTGLLPSLERLREVFSYNPLTGELLWIAKPHPKAHSAIIGAPAGHQNARGYINVMLDKKAYAVHRVAWKLYHEEEPPEFIDHHNGNEWDFSISNLRPATRSQNNANREVMGNSASGIKGVKLYRKGNYSCWLASYTEHGKKKAKAFPHTEEGLQSAIDWRNKECLRVHGEYDRPSKR